MTQKFMAGALMCLALTLAHPVIAQDKDNTLGAIWPSVEQNYPGLRAKQAAVSAAESNEKGVKGAQLPQVKVQAQNTYGTFEGSPGAFFPQAGFFNISGSTLSLDPNAMAANGFGSGTFELELFSFGKLKAESAAAHAMLIRTEQERESYALQLKKILSQRYIDLLYNDAKQDWSTRNADRLNDIRKIAAGLSISGLRPAADSLLASSSYIQALGELNKWEGAKDAAIFKLEEIAGKRKFDYQDSKTRFMRPEERDFNATAEALKSHPLLSAFQAQTDYYTFQSKAFNKSTLPSLRLLGGYAYRTTGIGTNGTYSSKWADGFDNPTSNLLAGIGLTWNITSLYTGAKNAQAKRQEANRTIFLKDQYYSQMEADLNASQTQLKSQFLQLQKVRRAVNESNQAYQMYLARYKSGLITLTELLQIRALLETAEDKVIDTSRTYWTLLAYQSELSTDFSFLFNNL